VIGIGIGADFVRQIYRDSIVARGISGNWRKSWMAILIRRIVDGQRPSRVARGNPRAAASERRLRRRSPIQPELLGSEPWQARRRSTLPQW